MNDDQYNNKQQPSLSPNPNEQKNHLLKNWKIISGMGILSFMVFLFLLNLIFEDKATELLKTFFNKNQSLVLIILGWGPLAVLFFFVGVIFALTIRQIWKEIPHIASEIKKDHENNQSTFKSFSERSDLVLSKAEQGALREMWLSRPWEYMKEIEQAEEDAIEFKGEHIKSISLYGTMVGFAFLLPEALRSHLCRVKENFRTLSIFASDAEIAIGNDDKSLVSYPLCLTAQFVLKLLECKSFENLFRDSNYNFTIKIVYLPYDLISAVIYLPPQEIAILQALDKNGLKRILDRDELQAGFRYINTPGEGPYERFEAAMKNIESANKVKKRIEIWEIAEGKIKIKSPHWSYEKDRRKVDLIISSTDYDDTNSKGPERSLELTGEMEINDCMNSLISAIKSEKSSGSDVRSLDALAIIKKEDWQRRHEMKCPCGGKEQMDTQKKIKNNKAKN